MTNGIKNICVYASASNDLGEAYYRDAQTLGKLIAQGGYGLVYGGSRRGLMYACAGEVKKHGGKVYGIMPEKLVQAGLANPEDCDEFIVTPGMRERKAKLDELSDAAIAIAGGFGTLEEISEMIAQKQLGYSNKPLVILNTAHLYNHLIEFFDNLINQGFADKELHEVYYVAQTPEEAVNYIKTYNPIKVYVKYPV